MKDILADIWRKLQDQSYQNEEHVRFALVGRLLQALGWDIWNPRQVNAEYVAVPEEDKKKVDLALFLRPQFPALFIEVKGVGRVAADLERTEEQLRDYNKNITALFCLITDGATWRFYYSQTQGRFGSKCFKVIDLLRDDLEDVEISLTTFLGKANVENGSAEREAQALLKLSQKQIAMKECLPRARRMTQEHPFPTLPDALITLVAEQGFTASRQEAEEIIKADGDHAHVEVGTRTQVPTERDQNRPPVQGSEAPITLLPERPESLAFTSVDSGRFGTETANNWNFLVVVGIKMAVERGYGISDLRKWLRAQVEEGPVLERGFHPVGGTRISLQYMEANRAWENAFILAKQLRCEIEVRLHWRHNDGAAHPGKSGVLRWSP